MSDSGSLPSIDVQQFLDITSELYCVSRPDGTLVRISRSWEAALGYPLEHIQNHPWVQFVHPDDRDRTLETFSGLLQGTPVVGFINRYMHRDGSIRWLNWHSTAVQSDQLIYAVARDVTAERQTQDQLVQERALLRALLDSIPDLIFLKDQDGVYTACNRAFETYAGRSEAELIGKTDFDFFDSAVAQFYRDNDLAAMASPRLHRNEEWIAYPDGRQSLLDTLKSPIRHPDGRILGIVGVCRDITERKEAEGALKRTVSEWSLAVDSMEDGLCLLNADGRIRRANRAFWSMSGGQDGQLFVDNFHCLMDSPRPVDDCPLCHAIQSPPASSIVLEAKSPHNPTGYPLEITVKPTLDEHGQRDGTLLLFRDLSLIREQERALRQTIETLSVTNAELERFSQIAAHDLQEPTRGLVSFSQLLERRYADHLDSAGVDYLHYIVSNAKRMQAMIRDFLTYSRARQAPMETVRVDLDDVLAAVRDNLSDAIQRTNARIDADSLGYVQGDPDRLIILFQHLLSNSMKFRTPDQAPEITISSQVRDGWRIITVSDNGIGIPQEHRQAVFGLFTRLHNHSTIPGTGIGLAVCQRISQDLGGSIWVEDGPNGGTAICLRLKTAALPDTQ